MVTPCVGVWIETGRTGVAPTAFQSHPAWVCGLKPNGSKDNRGTVGHTLRGCVD